VEYVGEVDLAGKLAFFDSVDVVSVPTAYAEAKGLYVLEALARGVAVVQPGHGAFVELIERTGGGELVAVGDAEALAGKLAELLRDRSRLRELGARGRRSVALGFTDDHMARRMLEVYQDVQHDIVRALPATQGTKARRHVGT
jgi:glycosyltransferase involved in cell wall biosynthesis